MTSPFSLLAAALGGGGGEFSRIEFAPGTASLGARARESLDKVAKALADRPALTLTVIGESRLARTRGLEEERLQAARARREAAPVRSPAAPARPPRSP